MLFLFMADCFEKLYPFIRVRFRWYGCRIQELLSAHGFKPNPKAEEARHAHELLFVNTMSR